MDESRTIQQCPAYLLGLLEPEEKLRVETALAECASLREALASRREAAKTWGNEDHFSEDVWRSLGRGGVPMAAAPALEHLLSCRECRFTAAVVLAEEDASKPVDAPTRGSGRRGVWTGPLLSLAVAVAVGFLGFALVLQSDGRAPSASGTVLYLGAERGAAEEPTNSLFGVEEITLPVGTAFELVSTSGGSASSSLGAAPTPQVL